MCTYSRAIYNCHTTLSVPLRVSHIVDNMLSLQRQAIYCMILLSTAISFRVFDMFAADVQSDVLLYRAVGLITVAAILQDNFVLVEQSEYKLLSKSLLGIS
jgi:hypothetical protein